MVNHIIISIGVEIEGGISWESLVELHAYYDGDSRFEYSYDSSVYVPKPKRLKTYRWYHDIELKYWSEYLVDVEDFVKTVYALGLKQNSTCGNHVHLKLYPKYYLLANTVEFIDKFKEAYQQYASKKDRNKKNQKYIKRMSNRYCKFPHLTLNPDSTLNENLYAQDRYYAVNFSSYFSHNTLEIRIMPHVRNSTEYIKNLHWIVKTVTKLLEELEAIYDIEPIPVDLPIEQIIEIEQVEENIEIEGEV